MNYQQTLAYLFAQLPMFHRIGAAAYRADLGNTLTLCSLLGNPERKFKSVHIAGTNGKGSTSHLIASILQSAGYKTGLYTSPHLKDFRERIRINGKKIPKSYVIRFVKDHLKEFEPVNASFFEYTAVMAFNYFAEEQVDIAVIETGMGGRLDSTNVVIPLLSVITNISKDHMAFLGNTLPAIAGEKAGIIKRGVPVLIGETQEEVEEVFMSRAREMEATIRFADTLPGFGYPLPCPLKGLYQEKNIQTSHQAAILLRGSGFNLDDQVILAGIRDVIRNTGLRGRWEIISRNPLTICDVGHNEAGIRYILEQIHQMKFKKLHWVFGMVSDKDASTILALLPANARYYFCKPDIPRGLDAGELSMKARAFGLKGRVYASVQEAYHAARSAAGKEDLVFVGGSTFVVAEVL